MQEAIEQLYAEIYQCQLLMQGLAERLERPNAAMQTLYARAGKEFPSDFPAPGAGGNIPAHNFPTHLGGGNILPSSFPALFGRGNPHAYTFPGPAGAGNRTPFPFPSGFAAGNPPAHQAFSDSVAGKQAVPVPPHQALAGILKRDVFKDSTTLHVSRAATLMLSLVEAPGKFGVGHFAAMLRMSYSGAGKFMMELRRRGLIRRNGYKVHILTPKGEECFRAAGA